MGRDLRYAVNRASCFNPRARTGRDSPTCAFGRAVLFQSTRPHGARRLPELRERPTFGCFNPRARTGRDARDKAVIDHDRRFQSTRPHGARRMVATASPS